MLHFTENKCAVVGQMLSSSPHPAMGEFLLGSSVVTVVLGGIAELVVVDLVVKLVLIC